MHPNQPKNANKNILILVIVFAAFGGLVAIGMAGAVFFLVSKPVESSGPTEVRVEGKKELSVRVAPKKGGLKLDGAMLGGSATMNKKYKPSSQYIEEGADSDVTELSFDKGSDGGANAPSTTIFDEETVQAVMYDHQEDLIGCYAKGLEQDETLKGDVVFHFRVAPDGHVAMVKITESGLRHKDTEDCLVDAARRWRFPKTGQASMAKFDTSFAFAAQ
jgi:hypothetical protein